jgi:AraC-like DNA-binding protein
MSDLKPGEVIEGRGIVIQFAPDLLHSRADVFPELADLEPFLTDALRGFEFFGHAARRGADLMRCIGAARGFQRLALFFELVDLLARAPEKKILASPTMRPPSIRRRSVSCMMSFRTSSDNLSGTIRMSEAAAIAGMKQSAFSRFFKKNTGANFVDYSRKLRVGRACKLLSDTRRPVTDICFEVGYANISNFNRHFRKERGVTPSQYKRLSNLCATPASLPA